MKQSLDRAMHSYPPTNAEDSVSFERNLRLLKEEERKPKSRVDVLKDLMTRTFPNRFDHLVTAVDTVSATQHISDFPLLKKSA